MSGIPLIGRLHIHEYLALVASFTLLILEGIARSITLLLPTPIIRFLYRLSRNAFNSLSSPYSRRARNRKKGISSPIAHAEGFAEMCELYGYVAEEHIVQTKDGYLLGVHRLAWRKGEEGQRVNAGPDTIQKKIVYLHHGLLMNSDVWVCITEHERCLPFLLVDQGYDVWLGNNRGNKYSKKSLHAGPTEIPFWNFSIDQFAFHDIPDTIHYILNTTSQKSLSYIGFSQGTAQAFAALSIHPTLNSKIDVFIALAPAMAPPGLASGIVSSLVKANPEVLYLAFGRRAILGSAPMWQALLYPAIFSWCVDKGLVFLFGWRTENITPHQKLAAYPHLYSFTSTKSVVHWFQIIRNGTFQMYDDEVTSPASFSTGSKYYKVAKFPTRNIRTPIVLIYGGSDSLVDIKVMLRELPRHTVAKCIPKYEHLDFLWAHDVNKLVFPHVLEALENLGLPSQTKEEALGWAPRGGRLLEGSRVASSNDSQPPNYSEDERSRNPRRMPRTPADEYESLFPRQEQMDESDEDDDDDAYSDDRPIEFALAPSAFAHSSLLPASPKAASTHVRSATSSPPTSQAAAAAASLTSPRSSRARVESTASSHPAQKVPESPETVIAASGRQRPDRIAQAMVDARAKEDAIPSSPLATASHITDQTVVRSRPEGWWSSTNSTVSLATDPSPVYERRHIFE